MHEPTDICIIGLGYVGLTLAVALAEAGYRVHGVENNPQTLALLRQGVPHFSEQGLDAKYAAYFASGAISIHETIDAACPATAFVITVGTPVGKDKRVNLSAIQQVSRMIASALKPGDLVMLRSTVKIGTTRNVVKPLLDSAQVPYALAMCPERTVEGHALEELRILPQIVGGVDAQSTLRAADIFHRITPEIVTVSSPEAAELAKLVNNTQRDLFFAYANEVALMAEAIGVDTREVIHAANYHYPRSRVARPGLVGGPCMEKDAYILSESLDDVGFTPNLVLAGRAVNEQMIDWGVGRIARVFAARGIPVQRVKKIAVLGLAFKGEPAVRDMRGSLAMPLVAALRETFPQSQVAGWDAVASVQEAELWGLPAVATLEEALADAQAVVIQNNHAAFRGAALKSKLALLAPGAVLYDFWSCTSATLATGTDVTHLGLGFAHAHETSDLTGAAVAGELVG